MAHGMMVSVKRRLKQDRRAGHRGRGGISILNRVAKKGLGTTKGGTDGSLGGGTFQHRERPANKNVPAYSRDTRNPTELTAELGWGQ